MVVGGRRFGALPAVERAVFASALEARRNSNGSIINVNIVLFLCGSSGGMSRWWWRNRKRCRGFGLAWSGNAVLFGLFDVGHSFFVARVTHRCLLGLSLDWPKQARFDGRAGEMTKRLMIDVLWLKFLVDSLPTARQRSVSRLRPRIEELTTRRTSLHCEQWLLESPRPGQNHQSPCRPGKSPRRMDFQSSCQAPVVDLWHR